MVKASEGKMTLTSTKDINMNGYICARRRSNCGVPKFTSGQFENGKRKKCGQSKNLIRTCEDYVLGRGGATAGLSY
jgi:hypothetical protein